MISFLISVASLIVGIVVTVLVSKYYFERSVNKSLTPYVMMLSDLLGGVRDEIRGDLRIEYQGVEVSALTDIRFLIGNSGDRPIRDIIDPLTLTLPDHVEVLDLDILHIEPEGREVEVENGATENPPRVLFRFPLLNAGEFFILRILVKGSVELDDLKFSITAEDLPPKLEAEPFSTTQSAAFGRSVDLGTFGVSIGSAVFTAALAYLVFSVWTNQISASAGSLFARVGNNLVLTGSILLAAALGVLGAIVAVMAFVAGFEDIRWPSLRPPKPVFKIPREHAIYQLLGRRRAGAKRTEEGDA
jgi:hypothetical protein